MEKISLLILLSIVLISNAQDSFVSCPYNSTDSQFTDCNQCKFSNTFNNTYCSCDKYKFNLIGRCISSRIPNCNDYSNFYDLIRSPLWNDFELFWTQKFTDARTTQATPNPLPSFMNSFDFGTMVQDYKIGWIQAYYLYQIFKPQIESFSLQRQHSLLFQTVVFMDSIINLSMSEKRSQILNFTNIKLSKNWIESEFQGLIDYRLKSIISCGYCENKYGSVTQSNSSRKLCGKCPPNCASCKNEATQCQYCLPQFYLTNTTKQCIACQVADCDYCSESGICNRCINNFPVSSDNKCTTIEIRNLTPCIRNYENSPCTSCFQLGELNSVWPNNQTQCFACSDFFCHECNEANTSQCLRCISYFYWNSNSSKCEQCPQNCRQCSENGCLYCNYGFGLSQNICKPCLVSGCVQCTVNISLCDSCFQGKVSQLKDVCLNIENNSYLCPAGCSDCYENNIKQCFSCQKGYFMDNQNKVCRKCLPNCRLCASSLTCSKCFSYAILVNNTCAKCPDNCLQCTANTTISCAQCRMGYELINEQCYPILNDGCFYYSRSNLTQCLLCKNGYTLHPNGLCMQCSINCRYTCNPSNITQCGKSKYVMQMTYLFDYYFVLQGCMIAINNECFYAIPGYNIEKIDGKFIAKYSCLSPCLTCNESQISQCFSCRNGYVLSGSKCVPDLSCNPNCNSCTVQSYRDGTNNCVVCSVQNCGTCFNGECLECSEGYYLENGTCNPCSPSCKTCVTAEICKTCAKGYVYPFQFSNNLFQTQICVPCSPNCLTCFFSENTCSSCHPNSRLVNARCVSNILVTFEYRLNIEYVNFLAMLSSQTLLEQLSQMLNISSNQIFILNITEGSTIINGQISAGTEEDARSVSSTLQDNPPATFPVLGSSFSILNNNQVIQCIATGTNACSEKKPQSEETKPEGNKGLSMGAIIGIAVGSAAFIIFVVVLLIMINKCSERNKKIQVEPIQSSQMKVFG